MTDDTARAEARDALLEALDAAHPWRVALESIARHSSDQGSRFVARKALEEAATPDPAGLDVEWDEEHRWIIENDGYGMSRIVARDVLPEVGRRLAARLREDVPGDEG